MSSSRVVMVRMNRELAAKFDALRSEFEGLPPSTIARMAMNWITALPMEKQIEIIESQVRHPGRLSQKQRIKEGKPGLNAQHRISREMCE